MLEGKSILMDLLNSLPQKYLRRLKLNFRLLKICNFGLRYKFSNLESPSV